jgi:hypothetical protein
MSEGSRLYGTPIKIRHFLHFKLGEFDLGVTRGVTEIAAGARSAHPALRDYNFSLSLVTWAARLGSSLTLKVAFLQLRIQTAESGLERLRSRLAVTG